jgi:hypothetical protein
MAKDHKDERNDNVSSHGPNGHSAHRSESVSILEFEYCLTF